MVLFNKYNELNQLNTFINQTNQTNVTPAIRLTSDTFFYNHRTNKEKTSGTGQTGLEANAL
jgi:hypothetical protein